MPDKEADKGYEIVSPLASYPGRLVLPLPDDFSGVMWRDWRKAVEDTEAETVNRLYGYAAARFIKKHGQWKLEGLSLADFQKWETDPRAERIKPVSWVGRSMQRYIDLIIDPKE